MNQDLDNMNERELLAELVRQGRRRERAEKIKACALAALLLAVLLLAAIAIPKILGPIRQISESMSQIQQSFDEFKGVLSGFDADTAEKFKQTMENLNETSQQFGQFMETLRDSGLDSLASAVEKLSETLGRLSRFFGG